MTNAQQIINIIDESKRLYAVNAASPSLASWTIANGYNNDMQSLIKNYPLTRAEYESMLNGENLRSDDVIYRSEGGWWNSSERESLIWSYAHVARREALYAERGLYTQPTAFMLGLELVTDGLPAGFREYQEAQ